MASALRLPKQLWPHQKAALRTINAYLSAPDRGSKAALVTMPTGTGKTGVIGGAVGLLPDQTKSKLILTPWDALVRQLITDLEERFWVRAGLPVPRGLVSVRRLPSSSQIESIAEDSEPTVYVATTAAVEVLARRRGSEISDLFSDFDFVMVDEGHYEPAPKWSQAIRALKLPTVLLSATPYRNDHNLFPPTDGFRYRFSHHEAAEGLYLRSPVFETINGTDNDVDGFVAGLLQLLGERFHDEPRVIVRCRDADQIRQMVRALERANQSALGVHERFSDEPKLFRGVPKPGDREERFWVHQFKLVEGLDDPRFKVLAFFEPLKNDRAIVQQIGRVLRNPAQDPEDTTALVIDRQIPAARRCWDAYTKFDLQEQTAAITTHAELVSRLLAAQPDVFYFDGAYRVGIDLDSPTAWEEFAFPLATRVFKVKGIEDREVASLAEIVAAEWAERDRQVFRIQEPDEQTAIVPYLTAQNSPWLKRGTFVELEFGYTLLRKTAQSLYITDTRDSMPSLAADVESYSPAELRRLFPEAETNLQSVSLLNTDIGRHAPRSRTVYAASIDALAPEMGDYAFVCSTATGRTEVFGVATRRYVGMTRGRVADRRLTDRTYDHFDRWLAELDKQLSESGKAASVFNRYAKPVEAPDKPEPRHVLLDLDPSDFSIDGRQEKFLDVDGLSANVTDGTFELVVGDGGFESRHECHVQWDPQRRRYRFRSDSLRAMNFRWHGGDGRELTTYINEEQALRVVPVSARRIYTNRSFVEPVLPKKDSLVFTDLLHADQAFADAKTEKGGGLVNDDWDPQSLFGLITALDPNSGRQPPAPFAEYVADPDLLFCSDLGAEVADFVIMKDNRVVFVHAKASSKRRLYSASALQEVVGQAAKNLKFIHPLAAQDPDMRRWNSAWSAKEVKGKTRRLRVGTQNRASEIWQTVKDQMVKPDCVREVWLVLGNLLSKAEFAKQLESRSPAPEAIQLYTLLSSTWNSVSQVGARLRVFCSP